MELGKRSDWPLAAMWGTTTRTSWAAAGLSLLAFRFRRGARRTHRRTNTHTQTHRRVPLEQRMVVCEWWEMVATHTQTIVRLGIKGPRPSDRLPSLSSGASGTPLPFFEPTNSNHSSPWWAHCSITPEWIKIFYFQIQSIVHRKKKET